MPLDPYEIRHLIPVPEPLPEIGRRTREHRCGRCSWDGTGSTDCPNYRPSQTVTYVTDPFEPACADRAGNRCMECGECREYAESRDLDARIDQMREERW